MHKAEDNVREEEKQGLGLAKWESVIATMMPNSLNHSQRRGLAQWSYGIVMTENCGLSTVSGFLSKLLGQKENTVRQRLKEFYKEKEKKQGEQRLELEVSQCFPEIVRWVLSLMPKKEKRLALVLDASTLGESFVILTLGIAYRESAIPIAWKIVAAGVKGGYKDDYIGLFQAVKGSIPKDYFVIVLADRGLYAKWLFETICDNGWHPFLRIKAYGRVQLHPETVFRDLKQICSQVGEQLCQKVTCFKHRPIEATLVAHRDAEHEDTWLILTDLEPNKVDILWYALRPHIELTFKYSKRSGWHWHRTRMVDPRRAQRLWLALTLSHLWVLAVGTEEQDKTTANDKSNLSPFHINFGSRPSNSLFTRLRGCFRQGLLAIKAALAAYRPLPLPRCLMPRPWPCSGFQSSPLAS